VPAVSGVLLDPVNPQLPDGDAVLPHPLAQIRMLGQHCIGGRLLASEIGECVVDKRLLSGRSFEVGITRPVQLRCRVPGRIQLRQSRSTSARWRSGPSKDMVDGGTDRRASCSGSNPRTSSAESVGSP
jgi:hypothetical protein